MSEHKWVVDYEPVVDVPVHAGSGAPTLKDGEVPVGENRSGIAVVITNGVRRVEVARVGFALNLRRRSRMESKLREVENDVARPACDKLNQAYEALATARREGDAAIERARSQRTQRVSDLQAALRRVEGEALVPWDGTLG